MSAIKDLTGPPASLPAAPAKMPMKQTSELTTPPELSYPSVERPQSYQPDTNLDLEGGLESQAPVEREGTWTTLDDDLKHNEDEDTVREHAMSILLFLSAPVFFFNTFAAIWLILAIIVLCLTHPFHLVVCTNHTTLHNRIITSLEPSIAYNLRFIYAHTRRKSPAFYSLSRLLCVVLASPFLSIGIVLAAWTAGCFWGFAVMIGDPVGSEGQEKRNSSLTEREENDGKDSVMWCRRVWKDCLLKSQY